MDPKEQEKMNAIASALRQSEDEVSKKLKQITDNFRYALLLAKDVQDEHPHKSDEVKRVTFSHMQSTLLYVTGATLSLARLLDTFLEEVSDDEEETTARKE